MIRQATLADKQKIMVLLEEFFHQTDYSSMGWSPSSISDMVDKLIDSPTASILVDDEVTGLIGGYCTPYWMNIGRVFVQEMFWYVQKDKRGGTTGTRLLKAYEEWAKDMKGDYLIMSSTANLDPSGVGAALQRKGFKPVDISYWKELHYGD